MSINFIYPDKELHLQIIRLLKILQYNSFNRANNPVLSIDKVSVFDFLLQHPYILFRIMKATGKKKLLSLNENEVNSIATEYPNIHNLYSFSNNKNILTIMITKKFVEVEVKSNTVFYIISEEGKMYVEAFNTEYVRRLDTISHSISAFASESYKNLLTLIRPYINGQ